MSDDAEYEEALNFFVNFEGVSKRALNLIPKNTLLSMKNKIDNEFVTKKKMNEILKKKMSEIPEPEPPMDEPEVIKCETCGATNYDFMYDHEKAKYFIVHCIYCGAKLRPPPAPEIIKRYVPRPKGTKRPKMSKYKVRNSG